MFIVYGTLHYNTFAALSKARILFLNEAENRNFPISLLKISSMEFKKDLPNG